MSTSSISSAKGLPHIVLKNEDFIDDKVIQVKVLQAEFPFLTDWVGKPIRVSPGVPISALGDTQEKWLERYMAVPEEQLTYVGTLGLEDGIFTIHLSMQRDYMLRECVGNLAAGYYSEQKGSHISLSPRCLSHTNGKLAFICFDVRHILAGFQFREATRA